jgi:pentose-5-phosphate-3-epimerase
MGAGDHGVTAPIDVHLMVSPVDRIVGDFIDAGVPEPNPAIPQPLIA